MTVPKSQDTTAPHYVYRCFDAQGGLLYVGCSRWPLSRIKGHRMRSWWGGEYDHHRLIVWPNREKALTAERRAIGTEMPRCNIKGRWYLLDTRDDWTAQNYVDFHHALVRSMAHLGYRAERTVQTASDVAAELLARHNVSIAERRRSA